MFLFPILLLASLVSYTQSIERIEYYRIESKVGERYSAIETDGVIHFTPTSFIIKSNNNQGDAVFIITQKVLESNDKIVYAAHPLDQEDVSILFEVAPHYFMMFDPIHGDGIMFLKETFKEHRDELPQKDIWYEKTNKGYRKR